MMVLGIGFSSSFKSFSASAILSSLTSTGFKFPLVNVKNPKPGSNSGSTF
jgi:hypothetical protein